MSFLPRKNVSVIGADVPWVLVVVCGAVPFDVEEQLREELAAQRIFVALLSESLAELLINDLAEQRTGQQLADLDGLSFQRLRRQARQAVAEAPWRRHFQTASVQPGRVVPLHADAESQDEELAESDLVRVLRDGSFLLLGEPGAGKTTGLLDLARQLAECGPRMPLVVPLGQYRGDFQ